MYISSSSASSIGTSQASQSSHLNNAFSTGSKEGGRIGIALNNLERPAITWAQVLESYWYYLGGVSYTGNQEFQGEVRAPGSVAVVQGKE